MSKTYALRINGKIQQVFPPAFYEDDVWGNPLPPEEPSEEHPEGREGRPAPLLHKKGDEIPIESRFHPDFVATLIEVDPDNLPPDDPDPEPPPMTPEEARARRDALIAEAALRVDPLKDAVELGIATAEEEALYTEWRRYRIALSRVDQQPGFPEDINWPLAPA